MKSKLVSLLKYSLGVFLLVSACNASAEYYIADASSGCGCDAFPPPQEVAYYHHHYRHHYYHHRHHYYSRRRASTLSFHVYYVYETAPACGCGSPCGGSSCGVAPVSSCGSANCDPVDWGPHSQVGGASYDWDTRTRDDVY